jgi:hypothetical protein
MYFAFVVPALWQFGAGLEEAAPGAVTLLRAAGFSVAVAASPGAFAASCR